MNFLAEWVSQRRLIIDLRRFLEESQRQTKEALKQGDDLVALLQQSIDANNSLASSLNYYQTNYYLVKAQLESLKHSE